MVRIKMVEYIGDEFAVEVSPFLLACPIDKRTYGIEFEDAFSHLHVAVALVGMNEGPHATDIIEYLGADGGIVDFLFGLFQLLALPVVWRGKLGVVRSTILCSFLGFLFIESLPACAIIIDYSGSIGIKVMHRPNMYFLKRVSCTGVAFDFDVHTLLVDGYTISRSVVTPGDRFAAGMPQLLRRCKSNENSNNFLLFFLFSLVII